MVLSVEDFKSKVDQTAQTIMEKHIGNIDELLNQQTDIGIVVKYDAKQYPTYPVETTISILERIASQYRTAGWEVKVSPDMELFLSIGKEILHG